MLKNHFCNPPFFPCWSLALLALVAVLAGIVLTPNARMGAQESVPDSPGSEAPGEQVESPAELHERGRELMEAGKPEEALPVCEAAFDAYNEQTDFIGPDKPKYLIAVGDALTMQGRFDAAFKVYLRAIEFELLGLPCDSRFSVALNRTVAVLSRLYNKAFVLEMWSQQINRGYLNLHLAIVESDMERARRISEMVFSLTRDLIAVADAKRPDHVTAAFTFASRSKAIEAALSAPNGIPVRNIRPSELERTLARYREIEKELLQMPIESTIAGQDYVESRVQVKLGTLEELAGWLPDYLVQLTYAKRAPELLDGLNEKLPPGSALVEFVAGTNIRDDDRRDVIAFVAQKNAEGALLLSKVWIEEQEQVKATVEHWRRLLEDAGDDPHEIREVGLDIREIFWRPVEKAIGEAKSIVLCRTPDVSGLEWSSIPGIPQEPDSQPAWLWPLVAAAVILLPVGLWKRSFWWLVASLVLMLAAAGVWYEGQDRLPVTRELGNDYQFQTLPDAYQYLRFDSDQPAASKAAS